MSGGLKTSTDRRHWFRRTPTRRGSAGTPIKAIGWIAGTAPRRGPKAREIDDFQPDARDHQHPNRLLPLLPPHSPERLGGGRSDPGDRLSLWMAAVNPRAGGTYEKIATLRGYGGTLTGLSGVFEASARDDWAVAARPSRRGAAGRAWGARCGVAKLAKTRKNSKNRDFYVGTAAP